MFIIVIMQYGWRSSEIQRQFKERQLPAISLKVPVSTKSRLFLDATERRKRLEQLKMGLKRKCQYESYGYGIRIDEKIRAENPIITIKEKTKDLLSREARDNNTLKLNLFGFEHMGKKANIGAVYPITEKEKEQERKKEWVDRVLEYNQKQKEKKYVIQKIKKKQKSVNEDRSESDQMSMQYDESQIEDTSKQQNISHKFNQQKISSQSKKEEISHVSKIQNESEEYILYQEQSKQSQISKQQQY